MDWLSQNWLWVAIGIGVAWYFLRGNLGGHGAGHGSLMGMGHGGGGHAGHGEPAAPPPDAANAPAANAPEAAVDPVSGEAVRTAQAVTSLYQEKIYYFASKENRDRFESAPQDYAHKVAGQPVGGQERRPRRRRGC